jgi:hypothetical protein
MSSLLGSFSFWDWVDIIGLAMVTIGVLAEVAFGMVEIGFFERLLNKIKWVKQMLSFPFNPTNFPPLELKKNWAEIIIDALVFLGLALELIALPISLHNSHVDISALQGENLELQLKLQPRIITLQQITNFMFLTQTFPKFPIRVEVVAMTGEATGYAWQIRKMLNQANYPPPNSDTNFFLGIDFLGNAVSVPPTGEVGTNGFADLEFVTDNTNDLIVFNYQAEEKTNGFIRYAIAKTDTNGLNAAFINYLNQDHIVTVWNYTPSWENPNHVAILVMERPR